MQTLDSIKNNLYQKANSRFSETTREQKLFLDWMARELFDLHRALRRSQDNVIKTIRQRLRPEASDRPVPVDALGHAFPKKEKVVLQPDQHVFTIQRLGNAKPSDIYFTPMRPTLLMGAKVRWRVFQNQMEEVMDSQFSNRFAKMTNGTPLHPGVLWLGIEPIKGAVLPKQLTFHFDFGTTNNGQLLEELLPLVQWSTHDRPLEAGVGMDGLFQQKKQEVQKVLDTEFLHLCAMKKKVIEKYNGQFVKVEKADRFSPSEMPPALSNCFTEEVTEPINQQPCVWLKLVFPSGFPATNLPTTKVRLNCFPILNRKMDKSRDFTPSHFGSVEVKALSNGDNRRTELASTGDLFLGIERIFTQKGDYRATAFRSFPSAPVGSYSLQKGRVEANDFRDVLLRTDELTGMLQENTARLLQVTDHSVQPILQNLKNNCTELEKHLHQVPAYTQAPGYYLHLKAADPQDVIYVEFWLSQGNAAEGVLVKGELLEGSEEVWAV